MFENIITIHFTIVRTKQYEFFSLKGIKLFNTDMIDV